MPRFAPFALFLLMMTLAVPAYAETPPTSKNAASDDPYTVTDVAVDVKGGNGVEARDKAFTQGARAALQTLATRLSGAKSADFKAVDDNSISRLVKSFEVEQEKVSGIRYIGKLTFHFRPELAVAFLEARGYGVKASDGPTGAGAPPALAKAPTHRLVVLPIVRTKDRNVLWEEKTSWARAFENYLSDNPDPNLVVPEGSVEDIGTISASEALAGLPGPLTKLMKRYEAKGVLVAVLAAPDLAPLPNQTLSVQLAHFDAMAQMRGTSGFSLTPAPQRKEMEWLQDGVAYTLGMEKQQAEKVAVAASLSPERTAPQPRPFGFLELAVSVPFANVEQWQKIRTSLQEVNGLMRVDITSLTHSHAALNVVYRGTRSTLDAALAEKGLRLEETAPDMLTLVPTAAPISTAPGGGNLTPVIYPPPPPPDTEDDSSTDEEDNASPASPSSPTPPSKQGSEPAPSSPPPNVDVPPRIP